MYGFGGLDPSERKSQVSAQLDREEESLKALEERMQTSAELTSGMKGQKWFSNQLFGFIQKIYVIQVYKCISLEDERIGDISCYYRECAT